jgi:phosphatidylinositol N-acetylglucosaminyltransferase subunit A
MVCDFFHPRLGGVENHIYSLTQHLIRQGHKVIVITHAYHNHTNTMTGEKEDFKGVRYFPGPLKVYYCPLIPIVDQDTLPTFLASLPLMRWILIREGIEIVHAHQATSTMANESVVYASLMMNHLKSVYTDHSLFSLNDLAGVILNRVLQTTLCTVHAAICVSHVCRDNFILRTRINPNRVVVIPNAVDASKFTPPNEDEVRELQLQHVSSTEKCREPSADDRIKIVVISRLVYRKGVDLLVGIIPLICHAHEHVDFIIGGDGAKLLALQEMLERERLQDRVELLGFIPHTNVRNVLIRGQVFLNCSLTESFCIAILEAASAGLLVVATNVGGVPEVLPDDMIFLAHPNVPDMVNAVGRAVQQQTKVLQQQRQQRRTMQNDSNDGADVKVVDPWQAHNRVKEMYSWQRVADETIAVYDRITSTTSNEEEEEEEEEKHNINTASRLLQRLGHYYTSVGGGFSGLVVCFLAVTLQLWLYIVEWLQPQSTIEVVPDLPIDPPSPSMPLQHHDDIVNHDDGPCTSGKTEQAKEIRN